MLAEYTIKTLSHTPYGVLIIIVSIEIEVFRMTAKMVPLPVIGVFNGDSNEILATRL